VNISGFYYGDGSQLTGITGGLWTNESGVATYDGNVNISGSIDASEISNTLDDLKIQPDVQGDVVLFGDTDVGNEENGKAFEIWRRAQEGNDRIKFYCSSGRVCYIHSSNKLTLQAQVPFTINSVTDDITFKVGDNSGSKKVYFKDSDGTNVATIDSDGNAWFDGSVGIGTSSPSGDLKLDVAGSNPIIRLGSTKNGEWTVGEQLSAIEFWGSDGSSPGVGVKAEIGIPARTTYGNWFDMTFKIQDQAGELNELMRIMQNGNVGIGTDSPDYALHLSRTDEHSVLQIEANGSNHGEANLFFKTQSDPGWQIFMDDSNLSVLGEADRLGFFYYGTGAGTKMVIDGGSGNVGIGTTNPQEKLHVVGDLYVEGDVRFNDTFFTDSGDVGIGIINPDKKLHIYNGDIRLETDSSDASLLFTDNDDDNTLGLLFDKSEEKLSIVGGMNGDRTPSHLDDIMTFTRGFRVGIKNSNPSVELDVNGNTKLDGNLEVTGTIEPLQFPSVTGAKLNLHGSNYALGVESSELRISSNADITFRTDGYNGNEDMIIEDDGDILMLNGKLGLKASNPQEELHINSTNPQIIFEEYDAGNSEKVWEVGATNEEFLIRTQSDLYSASQTILKLGCRGGTSIGCVVFPHGDVTISDLSGSGNDYACLDSTGKLFRSNSAC